MVLETFAILELEVCLLGILCVNLA
jgi:hypothetical protein